MVDDQPEALGALLGCANVEDSDPVAAITELERELASAWVTGDRAFIEALLASQGTIVPP